MAESGKVYAFSNYLLLVAGVPLTEIGGFAEGDGFEIEPASDRVDHVEGCDGSVAFSDTGSSLYLMKIKVLSTSAINAALTAIYETQIATKGSFPVAAKDLAGVDAFAAATCMISKQPKVTRGSKVSSHEWALKCADGKLFLGGN